MSKFFTRFLGQLFMKSICCLVRFAVEVDRCWSFFFMAADSLNFETSVVSGLRRLPTNEPTDLLDPIRCSCSGVIIGVFLFLPINLLMAFLALTASKGWTSVD